MVALSGWAYTEIRSELDEVKSQVTELKLFVTEQADVMWRLNRRVGALRICVNSIDVKRLSSDSVFTGIYC